MEFQELVSIMSDRSSYTRREIRRILRLLAQIVRDSLIEGRDVQIWSLGRFMNVEARPRVGRHPVTGARIEIPARRRIKFDPNTQFLLEVRSATEVFKKTTPEEKYKPQKSKSLEARYGLPKKERRMEKYGVEIDPNKIPKEKKAGAGDKDPHPHTNIPIDPDKGSEPYERRPDGEENSKG